MRKKDCVWPRKIQNVEADTDVTKFVGVSYDTDVFSLALEFLLIEPSTCVFFVVCRKMFLKVRKVYVANVAFTSHRKEGRTCCNSKEDLP